MTDEEAEAARIGRAQSSAAEFQRLGASHIRTGVFTVQQMEACLKGRLPTESPCSR
jgi:hypothetical protein